MRLRLESVDHGTTFPVRLHWEEAFLFPVATPEGRRDVLIGGTLILFC